METPEGQVRKPRDRKNREFRHNLPCFSAIHSSLTLNKNPDIKDLGPLPTENFRRIYAKHTLSAGDKRILSGLCREGYIAVNPCDSATNGVETKNPVIKDRKRERHKNGEGRFFCLSIVSSPQKIRSLPQDADSPLSLKNRLRKQRKNRQRLFLRENERSDFSRTN